MVYIVGADRLPLWGGRGFAPINITCPHRSGLLVALCLHIYHIILACIHIAEGVGGIGGAHFQRIQFLVGSTAFVHQCHIVRCSTGICPTDDNVCPLVADRFYLRSKTYDARVAGEQAFAVFQPIGVRYIQYLSIFVANRETYLIIIFAFLPIDIHFSAQRVVVEGVITLLCGKEGLHVVFHNAQFAAVPSVAIIVYAADSQLAPRAC